MARNNRGVCFSINAVDNGWVITGDEPKRPKRGEELDEWETVRFMNLYCKSLGEVAEVLKSVKK